MYYWQVLIALSGKSMSVDEDEKHESEEAPDTAYVTETSLPKFSIAKIAGPLAVPLLLALKYLERFTVAAKAEYARLEQAKTRTNQIKQEKAMQPSPLADVRERIWAQWYVRYAWGALMIWFAIVLVEANEANLILAIIVGLAGLSFMPRLANWIIGLIIGGALLSGALGAIATLPVSAAIIIGAIIIAYSRGR